MRLVLAARLSKLQTNGQQGIGIDTQDKRAQEWAPRNGHEIISVVADTKSGTVAPWDRPKLRPWVTDPAKMTLHDGVLAYKNDRLSRGCWSDEARIRLWAEEHGKTLVIVDGPQWPPRHDGDRWAWEAQSMQARKEWEEIRERSMRTQGELRERGMLVGRPPWGYVSAGEKYEHTMTPTVDGRRLVPEIYARVIKGDSLADVAAWLRVETGRNWWPRTIGTMIRNPVYIGHRQDADGKTIHRCESLVDAQVFRKAGEALDTRPKRGPVKPEGRAMLAGALYCPRCEDSPMYRITTGKPGNRHIYYRCSGRGVARKGCGNMVPLAGVDATVDATMRKDFDIPVMVRKLVRGHDYAAEREAVRFEIRQLAARDLEDDVYDAELAALRAERDRLKDMRVEPDEIKEIPADWTYAERWSALAVTERGPWLVTQGFRVTASTDGVSVGITIPVLEVTRETGELQLRVYPAPENEVAVSPVP